MKFLHIIALSAIVAITKVSACIPECWAEKLGYPCCLESEPEVISIDEHGEWSIENGKKCGILVYDHNLRCSPPVIEYEDCSSEEYCLNVKNIDEEGVIWGYDEEKRQRCIINPDNEKCKENLKSTCWSALLGYKCCKKADKLYMDKDGIWSIEDGEWCGVEFCPVFNEVESVDNYGNIWSYDASNDKQCIINKNDLNNSDNLEKTCRSAKLGYMCCKDPHTKIVTKDSFGYWGIENDKWCGFNETYPCSYYENYGFKCCENPQEITLSEISNGAFISSEKAIYGYFYRNKETGIYCGLNEKPLN